MSFLTKGLGAQGTIETLLLRGLEAGVIPAVVTGCIVSRDIYQGGQKIGETYQGGMKTGQAGCCE